MPTLPPPKMTPLVLCVATTFNVKSCARPEGRRQLGGRAVPDVLLRRVGGHVQQDRMHRSVDELRLRDRIAHEVRPVLSELQKRVVHCRRDGTRRRRRMVVRRRPLRHHQL